MLTHHLTGAQSGRNCSTTLHLHGKRPEDIPVWTGSGDHGGADPIMLGYLLDPAGMEPDRYNRASTHREGAWSILTGLAANRSMAGGGRVDVDAMLKQAGITLPR